MGKVCAQVLYLASICTPNRSVQQVTSSLGGILAFGICILGTNLLSHRYMLEKAKVMTALTYVFHPHFTRLCVCLDPPTPLTHLPPSVPPPPASPLPPGQSKGTGVHKDPTTNSSPVSNGNWARSTSFL